MWHSLDHSRLRSVKVDPIRLLEKGKQVSK